LKKKSTSFESPPQRPKYYPRNAIRFPTENILGFIEIKLKSVEKKLKPIDFKLYPLDKMLKPTDFKLYPLDKKLKPTDFKLYPLDKKLKSTEKKVKFMDFELMSIDFSLFLASKKGMLMGIEWCRKKSLSVIWQLEMVDGQR
jgi:hypothetical protein